MSPAGARAARQRLSGGGGRRDGRHVRRSSSPAAAGPTRGRAALQSGTGALRAARRRAVPRPLDWCWMLSSSPSRYRRTLLDGREGLPGALHGRQPRNWQEAWPPQSTSPTARPASGSCAARPIAVEVTLELKDWGTLDASDRGGRMMRRRRQRGVILISVLILVALAAVVAAGAVLRHGAVGAPRGRFLRHGGGAATGPGSRGPGRLCAQSRTRTRPTHPGRLGPAQSIRTEVAPGVVLQAQLGDLQGRFNINMLVGANGTRDENAYKVFRRLLELLQLDTGTGRPDGGLDRPNGSPNRRAARTACTCRRIRRI